MQLPYFCTMFITNALSGKKKKIQIPKNHFEQLIIATYLNRLSLNPKATGFARE